MALRLCARAPVRAVIGTTVAAFHTSSCVAAAASARTVCRVNGPSRSPASEATAPQPQRLATRMLINGEFRAKASDGASFPSIAACTGEEIRGGAVPQASVRDVDDAVQAAHAAFMARGPGSWHSMSPRQRGALLYKLSQRISECTEELAQLEALNNGKTIQQARTVDAPACASMFKYWAGWADKIENGRVVDIGSGFFNYTLHQPIGVCALVVPWVCAAQQPPICI